MPTQKTGSNCCSYSIKIGVQWDRRCDAAISSLFNSGKFKEPENQVAHRRHMHNVNLGRNRRYVMRRALVAF
jgi:hypothetical protein